MHGDPQYKVPQPRFLHVFWIGNYQSENGLNGGMILKVGDEYTSEVDSYISPLRFSTHTRV